MKKDFNKNAVQQQIYLMLVIANFKVRFVFTKSAKFFKFCFNILEMKNLKNSAICSTRKLVLI